MTSINFCWIKLRQIPKNSPLNNREVSLTKNNLYLHAEGLQYLYIFV
jgi:hypothetical protein